MQVDLTFDSNFSLKLLKELGTEEVYYFPEGNTKGGKDGLILEIISVDGLNWIGIFAFGEIDVKGKTGVYSMPDPDKFCVVSRGVGYIVSSIYPSDWKEVKSIPVIGVYPVKSKRILVFADYTELVAYDSTGIKWRTERLAYDGFKTTEVTEDYLKGSFWNIRNEAMETFTIDLSTGSHIGGGKVEF